MKTCPVCGVQMPDQATACGACGADYATAVVQDIAGGADADATLMLSTLDEGLVRVDNAPLPAMDDTLRRRLPIVCVILLVFFALSGFFAQANIFYILAVVMAIALVWSLVACGKKSLSPGEVIIRAAGRVFTEDAADLRARFAGDDHVTTALDSMQERLDNALALQTATHARNSRMLWIILAVVLVLGAAGVGSLAVRNRAANKAAAEYAAQPAWFKLRDTYLNAGVPDEATGKAMREQVVQAMVEAGEGAQAEEFFFAHCQGQIGDVDCATAIARCYRAQNDTEAFKVFTGKLKLRYDSDTRKVKNLQR